MLDTGTIANRPDGGSSADARILSLIYEHTSDAVCLVRVEPGEVYRVVLANESLFRLSGFERAQVIGAPLERFTPESVIPNLRSDIRSAIASRQTVTYERSGMLPVGPRYGESTYIPVFENDGPVTHVLLVMKDITARKLAELERERLLKDATFLSDATRLLASLTSIRRSRTWRTSPCRTSRKDARSTSSARVLRAGS
jgi:PAS domain S-box-containing protein